MYSNFVISHSFTLEDSLEDFEMDDSGVMSHG